MTLRVKVTRDEFDAAEPNGWVDGQIQGKKGLYVYVELGEELEYIPRANDNPKTEYRLFKGCTAYFDTSQENLEQGLYQAVQPNATVVIYC
jgi:hypothetical protein